MRNLPRQHVGGPGHMRGECSKSGEGFRRAEPNPGVVQSAQWTYKHLYTACDTEKCLVINSHHILYSYRVSIILSAPDWRATLSNSEST